MQVNSSELSGGSAHLVAVIPSGEVVQEKLAKSALRSLTGFNRSQTFRRNRLRGGRGVRMDQASKHLDQKLTNLVKIS